jgi:high-affinity nickel permease
VPAHLGKMLVIIGLLVAGVGVLLLFADKIPWMGRLPGDITLRRDNFTFYFPIVTCLVISVLVSLLLWLLRK